MADATLRETLNPTEYKNENKTLAERVDARLRGISDTNAIRKDSKGDEVGDRVYETNNATTKDAEGVKEIVQEISDTVSENRGLAHVDTELYDRSGEAKATIGKDEKTGQTVIGINTGVGGTDLTVGGDIVNNIVHEQEHRTSHSETEAIAAGNAAQTEWEFKNRLEGRVTHTGSSIEEWRENNWDSDVIRQGTDRVGSLEGRQNHSPVKDIRTKVKNLLDGERNLPDGVTEDTVLAVIDAMGDQHKVEIDESFDAEGLHPDAVELVKRRKGTTRYLVVPNDEDYATYDKKIDASNQITHESNLASAEQQLRDLQDPEFLEQEIHRRKLAKYEEQTRNAITQENLKLEQSQQNEREIAELLDSEYVAYHKNRVNRAELVKDGGVILSEVIAPDWLDLIGPSAKAAKMAAMIVSFKKLNKPLTRSMETWIKLNKRLDAIKKGAVSPEAVSHIQVKSPLTDAEKRLAKLKAEPFSNKVADAGRSGRGDGVGERDFDLETNSGGDSTHFSGGKPAVGGDNYNPDVVSERTISSRDQYGYQESGEYIGSLKRPEVTDPKLENIVNDVYKGDRHPTFEGTGSTADAARWEHRNGELLNGSDHLNNKDLKLYSP